MVLPAEAYTLRDQCTGGVPVSVYIVRSTMRFISENKRDDSLADDM